MPMCVIKSCRCRLNRGLAVRGSELVRPCLNVPNHNCLRVQSEKHHAPLPLRESISQRTQTLRRKHRKLESKCPKARCEHFRVSCVPSEGQNARPERHQGIHSEGQGCEKLPTPSRAMLQREHRTERLLCLRICRKKCSWRDMA
jgi:hypothetical protein